MFFSLDLFFPDEERPGCLSIDWTFVRRICLEQTFAPRRIPEEERELFVFKEEDYLDTVVSVENAQLPSVPRRESTTARKS